MCPQLIAVELASGWDQIEQKNKVYYLSSKCLINVMVVMEQIKCVLSACGFSVLMSHLV